MKNDSLTPIMIFCLAMVIAIASVILIVSPVKTERKDLATKAKLILETYDKLEEVHAKFIGYDAQKKLLQIEIGEFLTLGTDSACEYATSLFWRLAQLDRDVMIFVVSKDGFIPSKENPIDYAWAHYLFYDKYPDPEEGIAEIEGRLYTDAQIHGYD